MKDDPDHSEVDCLKVPDSDFTSYINRFKVAFLLRSELMKVIVSTAFRHCRAKDAGLSLPYILKQQYINIMATKSVARNQKGGLSLGSAFSDFLRPWDNFFNESQNRSRTFTVPAVNVTENDKSYSLSVAAPGLKKEDFKVDVKGNQLCISAEREEHKEDKDDQYSRKEYNYSSFCRMFTLPDEVEAEKIEAEYKDGELQLVLPKNGKARNDGQSIKIK